MGVLVAVGAAICVAVAVAVDVADALAFAVGRGVAVAGAVTVPVAVAVGVLVAVAVTVAVAAGAIRKIKKGLKRKLKLPGEYPAIRNVAPGHGPITGFSNPDVCSETISGRRSLIGTAMRPMRSRVIQQKKS